MNTSFGQDVVTADFVTAVVERSKTTPVLVDFWATWCAPCRALGPILEKLATEYAGGFLLAKVDTDKEQALAAEFKIRSIPTVMLFKDGKVVTGFQGALPEGQIRKFLTQHGVESGAAPVIELSSDPAQRVEQLRALSAASPERDSLKLELALAVLAVGSYEDASHLLDALPTAVFTDPKAVRARARVSLLRRAADEGVHPVVATGIREVLDGDRSAGLSQLLEQLREEKHDEDSAARAALVDALQLMDDEAEVRDWRRRMASVLF